MELFYQTFGFVAAICIGIMVLKVFFLGMGYFRRATRGFSVVKFKGFINDGKFVNIYLNNGKSVRAVRLVGFTDQSSANGGIPYQFSQMVVSETANGARVLIRADAVRMIEEIEAGP